MCHILPQRMVLKTSKTPYIEYLLLLVNLASLGAKVFFTRKPKRLKKNNIDFINFIELIMKIVY